MTDRSADGGCSPGQQEQPDRGQGGAAPPHLPSHNGNQQESFQREVQQDPHKLQLSQGELRHRPEARGSPTGAVTPDQRHPQSTHSSDLLDAAPVPSGTFHPTSSSTDPPTTASSTASVAGAISAASSIRGHTATPHVIDPDHTLSLASREPPSPAPSSGVATPTDHQDHPHNRHIKLRPLVHAVMAFEKSRKFSTGTSVHRKRQMSTLVEKEGHFGPALTVCGTRYCFLPRVMAKRDRLL
jgi:hypothetical protein